MGIPLVNLQRNFQRYRADYERILVEAAGKCDYVLGSHVKAFEEEFAAYLGVRHVIGVGSGTDALRLILRALKLPAGAIAVTQASTFFATALAAREAGCTLALCDCHEDTGAMDPATAAQTPAVVMPVDLFGLPANMDEVRRTFGSHVLIVEDAAQAHGSRIGKAMCGALGIAAGFSFYPGKNLGAFGDGGAVSTNDDALAEEIRGLRNWGSTVKYVHEMEGGNSRLDNLQAGILRFKLHQLDEWNARRNQLVERYRQALGAEPAITLPPRPAEGVLSCWHLFPIRVAPAIRDQILKALNEAGVGAGIHYPIPIHRQKAYANLPIARQTFPAAEARAVSMISLPLCPDLRDDELDQVCDHLLTAVGRAQR